MGDVKGRSGKLAASTNGSSYTDVGGVKDASMSGSTGVIDVTDMDSGGWEEHLDGNKSMTLSANANWDEADTGLMIVHDAFIAGTQIYLRWRPRGTAAGYQEYILFGAVTKFEESQAHDGAAQVSFDLLNSGTPTEQAQSA